MDINSGSQTPLKASGLMCGILIVSCKNISALSWRDDLRPDFGERMEVPQCNLSLWRAKNCDFSYTDCIQNIEETNNDWKSCQTNLTSPCMNETGSRGKCISVLKYHYAWSSHGVKRDRSVHDHNSFLLQMCRALYFGALYLTNE